MVCVVTTFYNCPDAEQHMGHGEGPGCTFQLHALDGTER